MNITIVKHSYLTKVDHKILDVVGLLSSVSLVPSEVGVSCLFVRSGHKHPRVFDLTVCV